MSTVAKPVSALQELKADAQWVCFNEDKNPFNPLTGYGAKADDPSTWASYLLAIKALKANPEKYKGVGREFLKAQGIIGFDLDYCIDEHGNLTEWGRYVIKKFNSYTEYSPSGRGLHIWVHGTLPENINTDIKADGTDRIEAYDSKRYFTVTGKHFPGTPTTIEDRQAEVTAFYAEVIEKRAATKPRIPRKHTPPSSPPMTGDTPYGLKALENECREIATTPEGGRNPQLNLSAFRIGRLVGGNALTQTTATNALYDAAVQSGLGEREIEKTLRGALEAGMKEPRRVPVKELPGKEYVPESVIPHTGNGNGNGPHSNNGNHSHTTFDLCSFSADDAGNGDALYARYGKQIVYCSSRGWLIYNGKYWQLDDDGAIVRQRAVEVLRERRHAAVDAQKEEIVKCTKADDKRVNGSINRFRSLVSVGIETFDNDPDMLNCNNGVVDLRTGCVTPHHSSQHFTYCVSVDYKKSPCTEWLELLEYVVGGGQEVIDYIQLALGYSFTGHTSEEVMFYLFGPTRSGKGTFSETIMALLPRPISEGVDFNTFTAKREGDMSNFDLAPLKPSRIIFASESNKSQSLNPAKVKSLTGGDPIRACYKHKDFFSYRPQFKVWLMSNFPVNGDPEDDALWGRVRVIEFPHSFLGIEDKSKKQILKTSGPLEGVLYWIVQGAIKWYSLGAIGLSTPASVAAATKSHRDELDYVQKWLEECCETVESEWTSNDTANKSYLAWCESNNVQHPKGGRGLAQSLKAKGYTPGIQKKVAGMNHRGIQGLRISSTF